MTEGNVMEEKLFPEIIVFLDTCRGIMMIKEEETTTAKYQAPPI